MTTPITRLGRAVARRWHARRDIRRLSQFDDRMLADIGITRGEIHAAVRGFGPRTRNGR